MIPPGRIFIPTKLSTLAANVRGEKMVGKIKGSVLNLMAVGLLCTLAVCEVYAQQGSTIKLVDQAAQAHGQGLGKMTIADWVGSGKITITGMVGGPADFTLTVKDNKMVQRVVTGREANETVVRIGSDGKRNWQTSGPFSAPAVGSVKFLIESQTTRSSSSLFANAEKYALRDLGPAPHDSATESSLSRVIESTNEAGQITRYHIDNSTSLITRLEFDTGGFYTMLFGDQKYPLIASYLFSDYRSVNGVMMPFRIEVYQGLIKIEEMNFTSVEYNVGLSNSLFVP